MKSIRRLLSFLTPYRRSYALVCVFGLINAGLEMIPPNLVGRAVDLMAVENFSFTPILVMAAIWLGIALLTQVLHGWQIALANQAGEAVITDLRQALFSRLQELSMSYYDRTHPGRLLTTFGGDLDAVRGVLIWGLNTLVANAAIMALAAVMIFHTDPALFWATVWLAPAISALNFYYGRKITAAWQAVRQHSSRVGANQAENIAGVRVVVAFNRQERNLAVYNDLQETNTKNNVLAAAKSGMFQPLLQWVRFIGVAIILLYGGYRVARGELLAGRLVAAILYWDWFMQPAVNFGAFFNELLIALSGAERVFEVMDEIPEVSDPPGARDLPAVSGHVRFENVAFQYPRSGRPILRDFNLEVPPGAMVAIVGATGGGKSTIISLLARFYQPTSGRILLDGWDLRDVSLRSLRRQMAIVQQSNFLFNGSIMENLRYARPGATDQDIFSAARKLGCHERFLALKDGYATSVGERGQSLSLGERQLVCFTRALVASPRILLLDEATSALDPQTGIQVQSALRRLVTGRTTFIVTHRLSTTTTADLIIVLEQGRIVEIGKHRDLLARRGAYAALYKDFATASLPAQSSSL